MRALPVLLCCFSMLASAETRWGLTWRAPDACIQAAQLARAVEDRLGRSVFGPSPEVRIDGTLERAADGQSHTARLTLVDEQGSVLGSRDVDSKSADCRDIDASLILVVAVMIDPMASLAPVPPVVQKAPALEPAPVPVPVAPAAKPTRHPEAAPDAEFVLGLGGALGLTPPVVPSLLLAVQASGPSGFGVDFRFPLYPFVPVQTDFAAGWMVGAGVGAQASWRLRPGDLSRWAWVLSAGADVQAFVATPSGAVTRASQTLGRLDLVARARAHRRFGAGDAFGLQVGVEAGFAPLSSTLRLVTNDARPVDVPLGPFHAGVEVAFTWPL